MAIRSTIRLKCWQSPFLTCYVLFKISKHTYPLPIDLGDSTYDNQPDLGDAIDVHTGLLRVLAGKNTWYAHAS